jgi:hypothetical protein
VSVRRLPYDVQRDMRFYEVVVGFRNAIELMQIIRGRPLDPDHLWWGFARNEPRRGSGGTGADDDGLTGSRVPRRPFGGADAAAVELAPPVEPDFTDADGIELRPTA